MTDVEIEVAPHPAKWSENDGRVCTKCYEWKPWEEFARWGPDRRSPTCKACRRKWARQYRRDNPDLSRARDLSRYGLTIADYDRMLTEQNGRCAICGTDEPGGNGDRLHVDHDHETGQVRGLLCSPCNNGLARFDDDLDRLVAAAEYLRRNR